MTQPPRHGKVGIGLSTRFAFGLAQGIFGLFTAGALLYELHTFFLKYYQQEWFGIQFNGVNRCSGTGWIANGDLFGGSTFCNDFLNFFPWLVIYMDHPGAAIIYYGVVAALLIGIGLLWKATHKKPPPLDPTVQQPLGTTTDDGTL